MRPEFVALFCAFVPSRVVDELLPLLVVVLLPALVAPDPLCAFVDVDPLGDDVWSDVELPFGVVLLLPVLGGDSIRRRAACRRGFDMRRRLTRRGRASRRAAE